MCSSSIWEQFCNETVFFIKKIYRCRQRGQENFSDHRNFWISQPLPRQIVSKRSLPPPALSQHLEHLHKGRKEQKNREIERVHSFSGEDPKTKPTTETTQNQCQNTQVTLRKRSPTTAHQLKVCFVPFSYASSSKSWVEISGFLNIHRSVVIGCFKPRNSRKEGGKTNKEEEEKKGRKAASKTTNGRMSMMMYDVYDDVWVWWCMMFMTMYEYDAWAVMHVIGMWFMFWCMSTYYVWCTWWHLLMSMILHDVFVNMMMFSILSMLYDDDCHTASCR